MRDYDAMRDRWDVCNPRPSVVHIKGAWGHAPFPAFHARVMHQDALIRVIRLLFAPGIVSDQWDMASLFACPTTIPAPRKNRLFHVCFIRGVL
jgi:hypothetical protein